MRSLILFCKRETFLAGTLIEPIVLPGSVFVSETVAALISFGYEKFDFEYAGNLELAKDFGSYPIYMLQRKGYSEELME